MENKTVLITGASRGIGKAIALKFASAGYNVIVNYNKSKNDADKVLKQIEGFGVKAITVKADVSDYSQVEEMFKTAFKIFKSIDVLINNAGISQVKQVQDITKEDFLSIINVNLNGVFYCCKGIIPHFLSKKEGKIINIASVLGINGASMESHYAASKAGVISLTKSMAKELGYSGINVNCISPGAIDTDMMKEYSITDLEEIKKNIMFNRLGKPEEVAELALFLAGVNGNYITGQNICIDGGYN